MEKLDDVHQNGVSPKYLSYYLHIFEEFRPTVALLAAKTCILRKNGEIENIKHRNLRFSYRQNTCFIKPEAMMVKTKSHNSTSGRIA